MTPCQGLKDQRAGPIDLLSNLPTGIIAEILGHVPIREAVRTSVLSSKWRYTWCYIPNLVFEDSCVKLQDHTSMLRMQFDSSFVSFVNRVLLLRQGPVHKFEISVNYYPKFSDINQWVAFLSRNGIEELSLQFGHDVKAPSSLFQCSKLTALSLCYFESLDLPVSFEGFKSLKSLRLEKVTIAVCSLEKLISGCPLLENLKLCGTYSEVLKIHAPFLKYLDLGNAFVGFILEKTPLLEEITVLMIDYGIEHSFTLTQFIDQVPLLQKLTGLEGFAKYLHVGKDPTTIAITPNHLWFVKLRINFDEPTEVHLLIRLMSSSPVLKELEIIGKGPSEDTDGSVSVFWSEVHNLGCHLFSQLKKVTVATDSVSSDKIEFVKFVLLNSPTLETMQIVIPSSDIRYRSIMKTVIDLLRCHRASTKAEILLCDG